MLLFGVTLTLIGTLYVRNNQNQSRKLAEMNKELAHKNFELSQEVNERERLNKVIQKSAREHRSIINAVRDIIFETDTSGKIIYLNEAWEAVTGFELERSIGRNLIDLLYVQDQPEQKENIEQLVAGKKKSYRAFTRLRSSDGTYRSVELAISMLRQDENKELRIVGTITDVEERRRAERALSEAERKYRTIVENAAGGIYQVTADGQFLSANPAFSKIIGFAGPEEVLRDVVHAHEALYIDLDARERFLLDIKNSKQSKIFEGQIKRKDGSVIWVRENVRPVLDDDGNLLFYEGSMEDVDQRKKAEIALQDAMVDSDLANRAKSEFLTNMSHELRTPLNAIIGFSEIIQNEAYGKLPSKEYKEYAESIFNSGQNLLKVINEILDVSRIDAGQRTLQESVVNVKKLFESCLELMDEKIKSNHIRVENKATDETLNLIGEKHAMKQMLLNIMSNAIKFSPENSLMMLDAELDSKNRMRVSITDTGIGLTDEELEKALSPFGQIETEHSRTKSGTGLGLTLVKSLIELHGGELEIVSQKAIGTTVTLIFPEKRVAKTQNTETEEPAENETIS
jgi:PAS domain S-box-containing protein